MRFATVVHSPESGDPIFARPSATPLCNLLYAANSRSAADKQNLAY
jgi:hypothetical protein